MDIEPESPDSSSLISGHMLSLVRAEASPDAVGFTVGDRIRCTQYTYGAPVTDAPGLVCGPPVWGEEYEVGLGIG